MKLTQHLLIYQERYADFLAVVESGDIKRACFYIVDAATYQRLSKIAEKGEAQDWQQLALDIAIVVATNPMPKNSSDTINAEVDKRVLEVYAQLAKAAIS
jgi:hypothetical protein